ncbi:MAG: hypothetical protein R3223_06850 [Longimicrobiales bacterium]|nr:hypothetical protein [Longimicrobiales bacterium]
MKPTHRTRLASMGVLFLVLVTGFLLGLAWDRADGLLRADESADETESTTVSGETPQGDGEAARDEHASREASRSGTMATRSDDSGKRDEDDDDRRLIVHRVGITPEQEARVDSIVDIHRDRVRALRRDMKDEYDPRFRALRRERDSVYEPRFEAVLMETRRSIRSLLSEEQAVRYDSLLAEHDRKEAERERRESSGEDHEAEGKTQR